MTFPAVFNDTEKKLFSEIFSEGTVSIHPRSAHRTSDGIVFTVDNGVCDEIGYIGISDIGLVGEKKTVDRYVCVRAEEIHENADVLRALFPFTAPSPVLGYPRTVGVGDRLGIAGPGHLAVFEKYDAVPVLAQQSIRELDLTGRTYRDVIDSSTFAVFTEDFRKPFGADGDHIKTPRDIEYALGCGATMLTLDCSEHIRNDVEDMPLDKVSTEYKKDPVLEERYLNKSFKIGDTVISFDEETLMRTVLIYGKAVDFAAKIYDRYFRYNDKVDVELSIDETMTPTKPFQHFFVSNELYLRNVKLASVAPRFCGEFQKGIDYIGDVKQFEKEFIEHAAIADHFGYKISVHSGSDKFSVFPAVGKYSGQRFHLKTAGTNWLEAMKLVAIKDPSLYREVHTFALDHFFDALKYYHVTTDLSKIPALSSLEDKDLPDLFKNNDSRQLIHITYGLILSANKEDGTSLFRDRLYKLWHDHRDGYIELLENHIGNHLSTLGVEKTN